MWVRRRGWGAVISARHSRRASHPFAAALGRAQLLHEGPSGYSQLIGLRPCAYVSAPRPASGHRGGLSVGGGSGSGGRRARGVVGGREWEARERHEGGVRGARGCVERCARIARPHRLGRPPRHPLRGGHSHSRHYAQPVPDDQLCHLRSAVVRCGGARSATVGHYP